MKIARSANHVPIRSDVTKTFRFHIAILKRKVMMRKGQIPSIRVITCTRRVIRREADAQLVNTNDCGRPISESTGDEKQAIDCSALTSFKFMMISCDHMQVEDLPETWERACLT
jgi:hypothetical protein